jgi:hypothetical protein
VKVAALYVATRGCYFGLDDVEPWDGTEGRDARAYAGPWPVVAHPPCARWGRYWYGGPMLHKAGKRTKLGDDGGCFAAAIAAVRAHGGVLEHPADSHAWRVFGITAPPRAGGWIVGDFTGGWTCCVDQGWYGHRAQKATWLYAVGCALPSLRWGKSPARGVRLDEGCHSAQERQERRRRQRLGALSGGPSNGFTERMGKQERAATPLAFRDMLLAMASSAQRPGGQGERR